jgi:copper transport protein
MQPRGTRNGGTATAGSAPSGGSSGWTRLAWALLLPLTLAAAPSDETAPPPRHTVLQATYPAADSTHHGDLLEVRLRYSTAVQPALSTITLSGPGGPLEGLGAVEIVPATDDREIRVRLPSPLPSGTYTVRWTTAGPDSHPLNGSFAFTVDRPELPAAPPAGEPAGDPTLTATRLQPETGGGTRDPVGVAVRALFLLSILGMLGAPLFRLAVLRPLAGDPHLENVVFDAASRGRALAWGVLSVALVALPARLWKQSADLFGAGALDSENLGRILGTGWGDAWILQAGMCGLFLLGLLASRRDPARAVGWGIMLAAGLGSAMVPALSGHAAATPGALRSVAILNDTVHVAAAGAWIGTLGVLAVAGLGAALGARASVPVGVASARGEDEPARRGGSAAPEGGRSEAVLAPVARMVNAFSRAALPAVGALVLTGLVSAWLQVGSPGALFGSGYGRTLLVKLALVGAAGSVGLYNWRVVRPALARGAGPERIGRSAKTEVLLGLGVVVVTAALIATPLP